MSLNFINVKLNLVHYIIVWRAKWNIQSVCYEARVFTTYVHNV